MSEEPEPKDQESTPFDFFIDWYQTLSPKMADEIAMYLSVRVPEDWLEMRSTLVSSIKSGALSRSLGGRLILLNRQIRGCESEQGLIHILCILVDSIMDRGPEYWSQLREKYERFLARAVGLKTRNQKIVESHQECIDKLPLEEKRWNRHGEAWRVLREDVLSFDSIQTWVRCRNKRMFG